MMSAMGEEKMGTRTPSKELEEIFIKQETRRKSKFRNPQFYIDPNVRGAPVDYSFRKIFRLSELENGTPREYRVGIPKQAASGKYISRYSAPCPVAPPQSRLKVLPGLWLVVPRPFRIIDFSLWANYNHLSGLDDVKSLVQVSFNKPEMISWLDVSFNEIQFISNEILDLKNLKILYLHGNGIKSLTDVAKLRALKKLRTLTLHGNPIEENFNYRTTVIKYLPQLINLDFSLVTRD